MARGINKVILIGNLGQQPEVRYMPSGGAVANISVATSETWKDKQTGQPQERTEWHRVVFFNRLAEVVGQYLTKGSKVYIEGSLRTRKWQGQDGQDRYTTEIVAGEMQMLDGRPQQGQGGYQQPPQQGGYQQPAYPPQQPQGNMPPQQQGYPQGTVGPNGAPPPQQPPQQPPQGQMPPQPGSGLGDFDDDIPF